MKIGIGIDTGGTCTDAVAFDYESGRLLAKGKALTTHSDLAVGIGNALDLLPAELIRDASLISLSTTLATNACVEDKGGRAKLLIFGLTDEYVHRFDAQAQYGLKRDSFRCVDTHGSADGMVQDEPDWDAVVSELGDWLSDADALSTAELYSGNNGAPCEKRAAELAETVWGLPCVSASELTSELNVLTRGATALLNARLLPIERTFIEAALSNFTARDCTAPIMVVRSDGSLMTAELARTRPVETILSGPAASVLAGRSFSGKDACLIIDMGGTTTDVSVVHDGRLAMAGDGVKIGGWQTHVKGVFVDTFALGGDSAVRCADKQLRLFPRRVMPLCIASARWPKVKDMLHELLIRKKHSQFPLHEFFYLVHEPENPSRYNGYERDLIAALRRGPCMLGKLTETAGIDLYHLDSERLEAEGIVMRCGLTPTDFMHIKGDYTEYDAEASILAARCLLFSLDRSSGVENLPALADEVYSLVQGRMFENLLRILIMRQYPKQFKNGIDAQTEFFIRNAWQRRGTDTGALLHYNFGTSAALIGVGAPTHIFLPAVAEAIGAECILPEHAEVANALGALIADIYATRRVEISQALSSTGENYYLVHAPTGSTRFTDFDKALTAAQAAAEASAVKEARSRGAYGKLEINTYIDRHSVTSRDGASVSLGNAAVSEVTASFR